MNFKKVKIIEHVTKDSTESKLQSCILYARI